jgi:CHAT domain-containing protein
MQHVSRVGSATLRKVRACAHAMTAAAVLVALCVAPARAQSTGNPLLVEYMQLQQLANSGKFADVVRRAPALEDEIKKRWPNKDFRDLSVLAIRLHANAYAQLHETKQTEALLKEALDITKKDHGGNDPGLGAISADLGNFYRDNARPAEAARYIEDAIRIFKTNNQQGKEDGRIENLSNTLATVYEDLGRNSEAEQIYKTIISSYMSKQGSNNGTAALYFNNLGVFYTKIGRFEDAATFCKRALEILKVVEPNSSGIATYSNNLASAYLNLGRVDDALSYYEAAISYEDKTHGPGNGPSVYYSNLGMLYLSLWGSEKDAARKARWHKGANDNLTKALEAEIKTAGAASVGVATYRMNLGLFAVQDRRYDEAEGLFRSALSIREQRLGPNDLTVAVPLIEWAWLDVLRDRVTSATVEHSRRAAQIVTPAIERELRLQQGLDAPVTIQPWATHVKVLSKAAELGLVGADAAAEAFENAQQARPTMVSAAVNQTMARIGAASPQISNVVREHQDLTAQLRLVEAQMLSEAAKPAPQQNAQLLQSLRTSISSATTRQGQLTAQLARDFPRYSDFVSPRPVPLAEVQRVLGPDEAMVFYYLSDRGNYAWAVTHDKAVWRPLTLSNDDLDATLTAWRASFENDAVYYDHKKPFDVESAHALYAALLEPVSGLIADKPNLIVVTPGSLATFPFHLLVTEVPKQPVVEWQDYRSVAWLSRKHAVTTLPSPASLRLLRQTGTRTAAPKPYLGFGDPIFANPGQGRLTGTATEITTVAQMYGVPQSIRLGIDATEHAVKTMPLSDYRVLHFATHGYAAEAAKRFGGPLEPSLALTTPRAVSGSDDGFLTTSEIVELKLAAELVVMSACESAAADKSGEALSGLARSFFYAGARSLIVSYWDVDSVSATRLITRTLLLLKQSPALLPAQAVRQAMNEMMDDTSSSFNAYPGMWAPFGTLGLESLSSSN